MGLSGVMFIMFTGDFEISLGGLLLLLPLFTIDFVDYGDKCDHRRRRFYISNTPKGF